MSGVLNRQVHDWADEGEGDSMNLFASGGESPAVPGTLASGNNLKKGAVLERSSFQYTEVSTPANACAVLAADCDASAADTDCHVYLHGPFHYADLKWPTMTADNKKTALEALADRGITVDVDITGVEATT